MKFYLKIFAYVTLSILLFLVFRANINYSILEADSTSLGGFAQILGTLYGIMAAFIIFVVWGRYDRIKEVTEKETDNLSELHALATYLEDKDLNKQLQNAIVAYAEAVINFGWIKLYKGQKSKRADTALHNVYKTIRTIKSSRKRFPVIFSQLIEKFEAVSDLRTQRVTMSAEHLPNSLKTLIIFDSIALILLVYLLPFANLWMGIFVVSVISSTVILTINVILDLDNPLVPGEWNLTPQPYKDLILELEERN